MPKTETRTAQKKEPSKAAPRRRKATRVKAVRDAAVSYFQAVADRDADAMARHWHADGVDDIVPLGVFRGPAAVRSLFSETFAAMPDMQTTVIGVTADDEVAAVRWRSEGTFTGAPFQGIEPTGRRVELRGIDCLEIGDDGLIRRNTAVYDGAAFARAIGMLPSEDSGADRAMRGAFNALTRVRRAARSRT